MVSRFQLELRTKDQLIDVILQTLSGLTLDGISRFHLDLLTKDQLIDVILQLSVSVSKTRNQLYQLIFPLLEIYMHDEIQKKDKSTF